MAWFYILYFYTMKKEEFIKKLEDMQNHLHDRTARPEDILDELRYYLEEHGLRNENEELRENYKTSGELEDMLRDALDSGIDRLYYFINNLELLYNAEIVYIDNYGNMDCKITGDDLWDVIERILGDVENWAGTFEE